MQGRAVHCPAQTENQLRDADDNRRDDSLSGPDFGQRDRLAEPHMTVV